MSFFWRVDLLVNPPLTLYFVTDIFLVTEHLSFPLNDEDVVFPKKQIEVTEHLGFPLNDEDVVFPKKQIAVTEIPCYFWTIRCRSSGRKNSILQHRYHRKPVVNITLQALGCFDLQFSPAFTETTPHTFSSLTTAFLLVWNPKNCELKQKAYTLPTQQSINHYLLSIEQQHH